MSKEQFADILAQFQEEIKGDVNLQATDDEKYSMSYIPYGIHTLPMLEVSIGRQGLPVGKIIELFGNPHCGKTTLAYHAMAETQRMGGGVLFIDTEQSFNFDRASECGVKKERMIIASCKTIEAAIRAIEKQLKVLKEVNWKHPYLIVLDSITGVTTESELERDFGGEQRTGHEAKQIRSGIKKINSELADLKVPLIMINHLISNIPKGFGPVAPSQSAGGNSPKFFSVVRLEVIRKKDIVRVVRGQKIKVGQETIMKVRKNKVNKPTLLEFDCILNNDTGFDMEANMLPALHYIGAIDFKGSIYKFNEATGIEKQFKEDEWKQVLNDVGGMPIAWELLYKFGEENKTLLPYGRKM